MSALHVTNGESAASTLREATGGAVVSWDDVLHDGPVPPGLDDDALAVCRARFLAGRGWTDESEATERFRRRDAALASGARGGAILLWFEHDLYDQLQLIQILERLGRVGGSAPRARPGWIVIDRHPEVVPFHGLGQLSAAQLDALLPSARPVPGEAFEQASTAWRAFTGDDPREWIRSADEASALPYLAPAMRRLSAELPGAADGLGRTERFVMHSLEHEGPRRLGELFAALQRDEPAPYLGDWSFFHVVDRLVGDGLIELDGQLATPPSRDDGSRVATPTALGAEVAAGRRDRVRVCGLDLQIGGVRLAGHRAAWRWNDDTGKVQDAAGNG